MTVKPILYDVPADPYKWPVAEREPYLAVFVQRFGKAGYIYREGRRASEARNAS